MPISHTVRVASNQMKGERLERLTSTMNMTKGDVEERLERYDMGEEYLIFMWVT